MGLDDTEFLDRDFPPSTPSSRPGAPARAPSREELEHAVVEKEQEIARLREAQEKLERARHELNEMRRRRTEFQVGRTEMRDALTRGIGLLEKAEFESRRDAEQMARTLTGLREAMTTVEGIREEQWTEETWQLELGRALTVIENARMEWNAARLKWPVMEGRGPEGQAPASPQTWENLSFRQLCRLGFALNWPVLLVGLIAVILFAVALWRR